MDDLWDFPPDVFWISPLGDPLEVVGHLTAMRERPELFGLHAAPRSNDEVDRAFADAWAQGWIRGRYSDGVFFLQMDEPRPEPFERARSVVLRYRRFARRVEVDFARGMNSETLD